MGTGDTVDAGEDHPGSSESGEVGGEVESAKRRLASGLPSDTPCLETENLSSMASWSGGVRGNPPAEDGGEGVRRTTMLAEPGPPGDVPDQVLLAADGMPDPG